MHIAWPFCTPSILSFVYKLSTPKPSWMFAWHKQYDCTCSHCIHIQNVFSTCVRIWLRLNLNMQANRQCLPWSIDIAQMQSQALSHSLGSVQSHQEWTWIVKFVSLRWPVSTYIQLEMHTAYVRTLNCLLCKCNFWHCYACGVIIFCVLAMLCVFHCEY